MDVMDLVKVIPNVLSEEECKTLINEFEKRKINAEKEGSVDTQGNYLQSSFKVVEIKDASPHYNFVVEKINYCLTGWLEYLDFFDSFHIPILRNELRYPHKIRLLRYEVGESIHDHIDWIPFTNASVTLNLNSDYEGGEFQFFHKKKIIKLKQGDGLVFPADPFWVHGVLPVTKGKRYSMNSFIRSYPEEKVMEILHANNYFSSNRERKLNP